MTSKTLTVTQRDLEDLQLLYNNAVEQGQQTFTFKGRSVLTGYAKFLIMYVKEELATTNNKPVKIVTPVVKQKKTLTPT